MKNSRHEIFAQSIFSGAVKTDAYKSAGYESQCPANAISRLLCRPEMQARISWLHKQAAEQSIQTSATTIDQLFMESNLIFHAAMKGTPVLDRHGNQLEIEDENGVKTKISKPDLSAANASVMARAKIGGLIVDKTENVENFDSELEGMSSEEIRELMRSIATLIDPNMKNTMIEGWIEEAKQSPTIEAEGKVVDIESAR